MKRSEFIKYLILNIFYFPLFCIFSYIVPKSKKLVLLGSSFGRHFSGNTKYYYLYLINNNKKDFYWVTSNKKIFFDLKQKKYPVLYFFSIRALFYILRAKYLIVDNAARDITYSVLLSGRFSIIQTWHATPLKSIFDKEAKSFSDKVFHFFVKKERKLYKIVLACSKTAADIMQSAMSNKNVKVLGYPRDDIFFDKKFIYTNYKQQLSLYKYNKILLYAPTFRDNKNAVLPFSEKFLTQLNNYLKENNYILLIKEHPLFGNGLEISNLSNILNVSRSIDDIQEILVSTDILISDYSSSVYDFSLTNKPIIFYIYDYYEFTATCRKMHFDYFKEMPGSFANNEEELFNLLKSINQWSNDTNYKKRYKLFRDKFNYYQDGKSCERLYNLINNL